MIEFEEGRMPEKRISTLTAYINETELMFHGKNFVKEVVHELIKQSVLVHRIDLENMVVNYITSEETKKYIEDEIRKAIARYIQAEIENIFKME